MVLDAIFKLVGVHLRKMTQQLMQTIWGGDGRYADSLIVSRNVEASRGFMLV